MGAKNTDGTEDAMIALWNDGESAAMIAGKLRLGSRNVVIGRINRMVNRGDARITRTTGQRPRAFFPRIMPPRASAAKPAPKKVPAIEPDNTRRVSLLDVGRGRCRFIIGEPSAMLCCGHDGYPYCDYHRQLTQTKGKTDEADVAA